MRRNHVNRLAVLLGLVGAICCGTARASAAQSILDRAKQTVQDKRKAMADSLSDKIADKAAAAMQCRATNLSCIKKAFAAGKPVKLVDPNGNPVPASDSAKAVASAGGVPATAFGDGVFLNYDFVPGDRVLFAEDFARDNPGDFPRRLQLRSGKFEVADWQGQRVLRANDHGVIAIPLPEVLPPRFTFEADYNGGGGWSLDVNFADPDKTDNLTRARFNPASGGLEDGGVNTQADIPANAVKPLTHIALMASGAYAKVYVNGVRVANVPNTRLGRAKLIVITFTADESTPAYLTNIRVAAGGKPLYDAIMADGRVATHGILFATGSDVIRGESKPTLDQIGRMLRQHPDLELTIEGHTDNAGNAASNQTLSDRRAGAVRQFLIAHYRVDASRLASNGLGASKPVASNDTPEGRQQNRRVELVKM